MQGRQLTLFSGFLSAEVFRPPEEMRKITEPSPPEGAGRLFRVRMDEAEMAAFDFLDSRLKSLFILLSFEEIGDPVSQGGEGILFLTVVMIKIHKTLEGCFDTE